MIYAVALLLLYLMSLPDYFERVLAGTMPAIEFNLDWPAGNAYFASRTERVGLMLLAVARRPMSVIHQRPITNHQ